MKSFKGFLLENVYQRQFKSGRQSGRVLTSSVIGNEYLPKVLELFRDKDPSDISILDAGSGKHALYTLKLREMGYDAKAIDLPENMVENIHNPDAFSFKYDIAFSGRVLNVFSDANILEKFISSVSSVLKPSGYYLCNLPDSPRNFGAYEGMSTKEGNEFLKSILEKYFSSVKVLANRSGPVFLSTK
jgi:SAM-dependent methyltransferase